MARLRFTLGRRYVLQGQVYIVRQVLINNQLVVENQSFGGSFTTTQDALCIAWAQGNLQFEVQGPNIQHNSHHPVTTSYTFADFQHLPLDRRDEAWRRYQLIHPLLLLPSSERTRKAISIYAASLAQQQVGSETPGTPKKRAKVGEAISRRSLEHWITDFLTSGGDIRSLVPATDRHGGKGKVRLDDHLERLIAEVLAECQATPTFRTAQDIYLMVVNRVGEENQYVSTSQKLSLPGFMTIYRRIQSTGKAALLRRRASRKEAQADALVFPGPSPTRIQERVEIDHTTLDFFVVDEEDRLPIGRPTLTYALDVYSGFPFGCYVGFEPPSYATVQQCLLHGILPKLDTRTLYDTQHPWPSFGLPETLVVDNGREFIGRDLEDACGQLSIILERMPVRTPWFKGSVERFFRTNNTGLIHTLPGTTFSNILERGDYDVFQHACISLTAFWKILHIFLLDIYAQRWHEGIGGIPAKMWAESMQAGFLPCLHSNVEEVRLLLLRGEERTVQRGGIDFESLRYQSPVLAQVRSILTDGEKVPIKYDPADLSALYVLDPAAQRWLRVLAVDQDYTQGLSLWKHRVIRGYVLREKQTVDIYALAAAKRHIQDIVASEFLHTRKSRGRKTAARFLSVEVSTGSSLPSTPSVLLGGGITIPVVSPETQASSQGTLLPPRTQEIPSPATLETPAEPQGEQQDASTAPPRSRRSPRKVQPPVPPPAPARTADTFDTTGWGGDYSLPRHVVADTNRKEGHA